MNRIAFAVRLLLLLLPDVLDAVAFPFDILPGSSDGLEDDVHIEHAQDTLTASSSGISVASEKVSAQTAGSQGGQQYDAATLESMAMGMSSLAGTPEIQEGMSALEQIVNDTIAGLYGNYWYQINREPDLYIAWQASTAACNYTKHDDPSIPSLADAHLTCRQQQSEIQTAFDAATECAPEYQKHYAGLRYARCDNFWSTTNVFPRAILPDACKRQTDEVNQAYVSRVVEQMSGLQQTWTTAFTTCQAIIDAYTNTTTYCSDLTTQLANKTAECDGLQQQMDAVTCNLFQGTESISCAEYEACWKAANDTYIRENSSIATTDACVEGEVRAMKRVRCIIRALQLPQGDIDEALEVCQNMTFSIDECWENLSHPTNWTCKTSAGPLNFSYYLVDWNPPNTPTLPAANCTGGTDRPCTASYVNTYFLGLPQNAPAAPSTVDCCTMCEYFDGCGVNLTRPDYRSVKGFDENTCCLTAKWQISDWTPALFGNTCPTGCGHTTTFYSRSIECVSEIGTPVPESECVRLQGLKDVSELTCTPTATCTNCSACGWGYERQGCDPTATPPTYGQCVPCQKDLGAYFAAAGSCEQPKCGNCSIGQYNAGCQFSFGNPGTCTGCTEKLGTYFTGAGAFVDLSCPTANCTVCRNGQYNRGCSGSNAGTCDDCTGANDSGIVGYQQYYSGPGTIVDVNTSCPKKICDYTRCPFGQVLDNCGGSNPGTCVECQPECSQFEWQAACHKACSWNTVNANCEATQYVVQGALGRCRFAPCEPRICAAGEYLANCSGTRNGSCSPCNAPPAGRFFTGPGRYSPQCPSTECQNCSTGYYRANCSGANGGSCVACSDPPAGNYFTSHGGSTDSCPYEPCSGARCKAGHYLTGCGGRDKGTCKTCTGHVADHYFSSHGFLNNSCPTKACNASQCAVGMYLRNCGGHLAPASAGACQPCSAPPEGYYWVTNGSTNNHCRASRCFDVAPACPAGQYRKGCGGKGNATGTGWCAPCTNVAPGSYYMTGPGNSTGFCPQTSCDSLPNCEIAHFRVGCGSPVDPTSQGNCSATCPAPHTGYYHYEGCLQKACPSCGAGQYRANCGVDSSNHSSSGICTDCANPPAGKYFNMAISSGCTPQECTEQTCGNGQYRTGCGNRTVGTCASCTPPTGFYVTGPGSLNATSCPVASCDQLTPCTAGEYVKDCGTASLPMSTGHCSSCAQPPTGMYYSAHGNSSGNQSCPTKRCDQEASCPAGQYRSGCGTDSHSSYTNIGICTSCSSPPTGFYLNTSGGINDSCTQTSCEGAPACQTGYYRKDCGGHDNPSGYGTCVKCTPPAADRYYDSHGYLNDSCHSETCVTAGECTVGEYRKDCGGENDPTSRGFCTNCTATLRVGNVWLTDGDLSNDCTQGVATTTTAAAR